MVTNHYPMTNRDEKFNKWFQMGDVDNGKFQGIFHHFNMDEKYKITKRFIDGRHLLFYFPKSFQTFSSINDFKHCRGVCTSPTCTICERQKLRIVTKWNKYIV